MMRSSLPAFAALGLAIALSGCGTAIAPGVQTSGATLSRASEAAPVQKSHLYTTLDILGIGPVYQERLKAVGIALAIDLLEAGHTRNGRLRLAQETGISPKLLLTWINHADLIRVIGAGPVYARLLEDAGVDTVAELAARNPVNLRDALESARVKGGKTMVERMPSVETVAQWVSRAKTLGRYVEY